MPLNWNDDASWILRTEQPLHGCAPPYVANGRLGLRLGALILGTDREAPPLVSAAAEICLPGTPQFDHSYPLQSFAAQGRDGYLHCLPSWANIDLRVGDQRFEPQGMGTSSLRPLHTWLDLRTGEAGLSGVWRCGEAQVEVTIRLLIPRGHPNGGFWELELDGLEEPADITFGLEGEHLTAAIEQLYREENGNIIGNLRTKGKGRTLGLGLRWQIEGGTTEVTTGKTASVHVSATGKSLRLRVFHAVHGGTDSWKESDVHASLAALEKGLADGSLRADNASLWRELWKDALDITQLPLDKHDQRLLLAQQFYLLASYDGAAYPTAPLGLSGNNWAGQMLWDTDLWHFKALNALWPQLARQPVRTRLGMLPGARKHAAKMGLAGAWFGWMCDEEGNEIAPEHYQRETHVNAWIALAAWESAKRTEDRAWLEEVYPLLSGIADATCTRAERSADGAWHLRKVLPPDEAVVENKKNPGFCDDSVSTNLAFRGALRAAITAAKELGQSAPTLWTEVADGLTILPPGPDGIIPEYDGYTGHPVKQADLILAFWPLESDYPGKIVRANLDYYRDRVVWGPLMTVQIEACIRLRHGLGQREEILRDCLTRYRRYVRGAFEAPYECIDNSNSLMLTGCGGLLLTLIYGWFDVRVPSDLDRLPKLLR